MAAEDVWEKSCCYRPWGAAILQAIKAVSQYVIENEAEFISQLKTVWNENKSKSANNGQQEIDEAKYRLYEVYNVELEMQI